MQTASGASSRAARRAITLRGSSGSGGDLGERHAQFAGIGRGIIHQVGLALSRVDDDQIDQHAGDLDLPGGEEPRSARRAT